VSSPPFSQQPKNVLDVWLSPPVTLPSLHLPPAAPARHTAAGERLQSPPAQDSFRPCKGNFRSGNRKAIQLFWNSKIQACFPICKSSFGKKERPEQHTVNPSSRLSDLHPRGVSGGDDAEMAPLLPTQPRPCCSAELEQEGLGMAQTKPKPG